MNHNDISAQYGYVLLSPCHFLVTTRYYTSMDVYFKEAYIMKTLLNCRFHLIRKSLFSSKLDAHYIQDGPTQRWGELISPYYLSYNLLLSDTQSPLHTADSHQSTGETATHWLQTKPGAAARSNTYWEEIENQLSTFLAFIER